MQILWNNKYKNSCRPFQERSPVPPPGGADDEVRHHRHHQLDLLSQLDQLTTTNLNPTSTVSSPTRSQLQSQLANQMQGMGATDQMQVLQSLQHMAGRKQKEVRKIIFFIIFTNFGNKIESFLGGFHNLVLSGSSCLFLSPESGSGLTRRHFLPTFKASTAQTLYCILKRAEY